MNLFCKYLVLAGYLILIILFLFEFKFYHGIVANYFFLPLWVFVLLFVLFLLILKKISPQLFAKQIKLANIIKINNKVILPLAMIIFFILSIVETYTHPNFVFSQFQINYLALIALIILSFCFSIITNNKSKNQKNWQFYLFFAFLISCIFLYHYYFQLFFRLSANLSYDHDDNFMEWLQVLILVFVAFVTFILGKTNKQNISLKFCYFLISFIFVLLIGEEISWGSRVFNFTPNIGTTNYQQEFNLHNAPIINEVTALLYAFVFLYAVFSWRFSFNYQRKHTISSQAKPWWDMFCFKASEVIYFLPTFIINPYASNTIIKGFPPPVDFYYQLGVVPNLGDALNFLAQWRESLEVLFYAGLTLHFINIYNNQMKTKINKA